MSLFIDPLKRGARRPAGAAAVILFLGLGASASASAAEPDLERSCSRYASEGVRVAECADQLRLARDATAKYRDPAVALRDDFVPGECVDAASEGADPALGAMGEHWIRVDRMADEKLDPREPEILLYMPTPTGRRLVAVEWSIAALEGGLPRYGTQRPDPDRTAAAPRMFGGGSFDGPMQGHNLFHAWPYQPNLTAQPWHYDLHVWLWNPNPAGVLAQYNRRVSCKRGPAAGDDGDDEAGAPSAARPPKARLPLCVLPRETPAGR